MKIAFLAIWTLLCIALALVAPTTMYFAYHLMAPTTELTRILCILGLVAFGGGATIGLGFLSFALWVGGLKVALD